MEGLDGRAVLALEQMVRELERRGAVPGVLAAFSRVPRHRFLDRFWSAPKARDEPGEIREWRLDGDAVEEAVELLHDPSRALAVHASGDWDEATSTMSAPVVVAALLGAAEIEPGASVLEIGTGTGYTSAVLAEMVGPHGRVTTVEIDEQLSASARRTLADLGYATTVLVAGDGDLGASAGAPFDRVVATVGCADLSPHWHDQLAADGLVVVPLERGREHPITRARAVAGGFVARVVDRARFVRIQGAQSRPPLDEGGAEAETLTWRPLPDGLGAGLEASGSAGRLERWSLDYYLSLRSPNDAPGTLTAGQASCGVLDAPRRHVGVRGEHGEELAQRLLEAVGDFEALGRPTPMDYVSRFGPIGSAAEDEVPGGRLGPWRSTRVHYEELSELDWGAAGTP